MVAFNVATAPAASAAQPKPGHTKLVPDIPRTNTPRITTGEITDIEYIGNRVFIAGTFTSIRNNTSTNTTNYNQAYVASYNIDTGLVDTAFKPVFAGGGVTEIEASPDGTKLFVAGRFTTINGVSKKKVASISPTTGAPVAGFTANANGAGTTLAATNTTLYIGGQFTTINNVAKVGLAAVNASTGAVVTGFSNDLSGGIGVDGALTVQALVLSHDDSKLMVVHTGRKIAGQDRYGVGLIGTSNNQLLPWRTRLWEDNLQFVGGIQRAYAGDIAPNDQYMVVTSGSGGDRPPVNDTVIAFPIAGNDNVQPLWISRCFDSVYSVAVAENAVYVGGHFSWNESQLAPDPWPGLDNVGYGTGQGLGGYGLGDAVVRRDHIGALDPTNGKALEWNPGSNSFEGNKAMLVTPRGLFAGGDATTQGGYNVGRVAFYDFNTIPAASPYDTKITSPVEGYVFPAGQQFTLTGTATATSGVSRVQLEIIDTANNRYLQKDLVTWGAATVINTNLASPNAVNTTWSLPLTVAGNHAIKVQAKAFAVNGSSDATKAIKKFETFSLDDRTPSASISGPSSPVMTTTFTVTGTATDDHGVNSLSYTLRDTNTNRYVQDDGSAGATYNSFRITPDVVGGTNTTWSVEVEVPYEGSWQMQVVPVDTSGQSSLDTSDRTWIVSTTGIAPSVNVTAPAVMNPPTATAPLTVAPGGKLTFSGSASDDQNLFSVEIQLRNSTTRENLASDGTWSTDVQAGWFRVTPLNLNATTTNWSWTTPFNLKQGTYSFSVKAVDDVGLETSSGNQGKLTINAQIPGDTPPNGLLNVTGNQVSQVLNLNIAGTATDDKGVASVKVAFRETTSSRYLQADGTLSAAFATRDAVLATPNGTSTTWTLGVNLPSQGNYSVTAYAYDNAGQQDTSTTGATATYQIFPGDLPPTVTANLMAPQEGATFTDARIFVSGRVEDDQQIAQAQVAIVDSNGRYMSSSGTFTSTSESWRSAFLNSPGSPGSNYSYTTPVIPAGSYTVRVRGVDQHGFATNPTADVHVTVTVPPNNPPVANFTVSCAQNVCTFDGRTSTDENTPALTYSWNFGQGSGSGAVATKTYTSAATFNVVLTVTDEYGATATKTTPVTVTEPAGNVAPVAVIGTPSCALLVCNFSGAASTDANVGDTRTYAWNWGDGTAQSTSASPSHTFAAAGTYTVTLTVTDGWGKFTTATVQVTVSAV
ncbi:PKD domain-containing protein [Catellatospora sp. KI3]|uniref:PKD domain-containing protein n=1 Tax=Catellatospora sp. KI3 TaxID=3041620 RepID=UPI002483134B|nr:PKD domain-containing protein [Catellatospora sp. KI3]MDI1461847.1 PKD domain-containing protein [Catellatospora sp. KI3]